MNLLIFLTALGLLVHFLGDLMEASAIQGSPVHPWHFLKGKPYRAAMSLIGATLGFLMLMNDLDKQVMAELYQSAYATAFGIGYASDSLINKAANIAQRRIDE